MHHAEGAMEDGGGGGRAARHLVRVKVRVRVRVRARARVRVRVRVRVGIKVRVSAAVCTMPKAPWKMAVEAAERRVACCAASRALMPAEKMR